VIDFTLPYVFNVYLRVQTRQGNGENIAFHKWEGLTGDQLVRWSWYFKYRQALYRVKYPRSYSTISEFKYVPSGPVLCKKLYNQWLGKKRKVSEWKNKVKKAEEQYDQLFPIETHPVYAKALLKLERLKQEFEEIDMHYQQSLKDIDL